MRAFEPLHSMLRAFVVLRVIIVSTLLLSAFLIQLTFSTALPLNLIYYLAAFAYSISIVAILSLDRIPAETNAGVQLLGDLVVITGLVYVSGGPDSSFTFLYLSTVTAGAILLGRRGGLVAAGLAAVFYAVLVDLMYFEVVQPVETASGRGTSGRPPASSETSRCNVARLRRHRASRLRRVGQAPRGARRRGAPQGRDRPPPGAPQLGPDVDVLGRPHDGPRRRRHVREPRRAGAPRRAVRRPRRAARSSASGSSSEADWETDRGVGLRDPPLREHAPPQAAQDAYFGISATALRDGSGYTIGRILIFQNLTDAQAARGRSAPQGQAGGRRRARRRHRARDPQPSRLDLRARSRS